MTAEASRTDRWIGALPDRYQAARLSHVATAWTSNVDKHSVDSELPVRLCNYTDVYKNAAITADLAFMSATASPEQLDRFRLRHGDTVITKDSETADDIGIPTYVDYEADDLVCGYHLAIVRPLLDRADPRFLFWVMGSRPVLGQWSVLAAGVTRVGIRSSDLTKVLIPLPAVDEQRAIADFLDEQTSRIDTLIDKQTKLITTLRERLGRVREALAVRVGSGDRLKWRLVEIDDRAGSRADELPLMSVSIDWGVRRRDETTSDDHRADDLGVYKLCAAGDIVVNRMRAFQGALGVAPQAGLVSPDYAVLRARSATLDCDWMVEVMRTRAFIAEMVLRIRGIGGVESGAVRTPRINVADLLDIRVASTPTAVQGGELGSVRAKRARIDALIEKTERHVALAKERRAALITAAVTGQIDVRTAGQAQQGVA